MSETRCGPPPPAPPVHDAETISAGAPEEVRARVRRSYAAAATGTDGCGCCGGASPQVPAAEVVVRIGVAREGAAVIEETPALGGPSLGCGNPLPVAGIRPGEVVLDLGSGAGAEVLRAARLAAPGGKAIGLDMTAEMLALSAGNRRSAGADNAFFVGGEIEALPLRDGSVDVIVSNCVLNLSPEKAAVFAEAWRVLRPGGRLAVADVVIAGDAEPPASWRDDAAGWDGCIRGAMTEGEVLRRLDEAGFEDARLERLSSAGADEIPTADVPVPRLASDLILAVKPLDGARREANGGRPSDAVGGDAVRRMRPGELHVVEALVRAAGLDPTGLDAAIATVLVGQEGGEIVGCAGYERAGGAALLRSVAVREDRRGRGWGARLARETLESAWAGGATEAWLLTETAGPFFLRLGWMDVGRAELDARFPDSPQVCGTCPASARAMRLVLGSSGQERSAAGG